MLQDIDAPERAHELRWAAAIGNWYRRDARALEALIAEGAPLPDFAKEFLCDVVAGRAHRGTGGRPATRTPADARIIAADAFAAWEDGGSKEIGIEQAAALNGLKDGAVRRVVDDAIAAGWTLENWIAWGRPRFTDT